jgi:hypothetical protein
VSAKVCRALSKIEDNIHLKQRASVLDLVFTGWLDGVTLIDFPREEVSVSELWCLHVFYKTLMKKNLIVEINIPKWLLN